jgi:hypothetical protein
MGKVRNHRLDNLAEAIAEDRQRMASARADEQGSIQAALREMKAKKLGAYKHAGVEFAFVPGEDKLRVRLTKDAEDSSQAFEASGDGGEDEAPEGGDLADDDSGDGDVDEDQG